MTYYQRMPTVEELQERLHKYHQTLVEERKIKTQLTTKLRKIKTAVYGDGRLVKRRGIPFMKKKLASQNKYASQDKYASQNKHASRNRSAEQIVKEIKNILG